MASPPDIITFPLLLYFPQSVQLSKSSICNIEHKATLITKRASCLARHGRFFSGLLLLHCRCCCLWFHCSFFCFHGSFRLFRDFFCWFLVWLNSTVSFHFLFSRVGFIWRFVAIVVRMRFFWFLLALFSCLWWLLCPVVGLLFLSWLFRVLGWFWRFVIVHFVWRILLTFIFRLFQFCFGLIDISVIFTILVIRINIFVVILFTVRIFFCHTFIRINIVIVFFVIIPARVLFFQRLLVFLLFNLHRLCFVWRIFLDLIFPRSHLRARCVHLHLWFLLRVRFACHVTLQKLAYKKMAHKPSNPWQCILSTLRSLQATKIIAYLLAQDTDPSQGTIQHFLWKPYFVVIWLTATFSRILWHIFLRA